MTIMEIRQRRPQNTLIVAHSFAIANDGNDDVDDTNEFVDPNNDDDDDDDGDNDDEDAVKANRRWMERSS